jgi:hypothetical protein
MDQATKERVSQNGPPLVGGGDIDGIIAFIEYGLIVHVTKIRPGQADTLSFFPSLSSKRRPARDRLWTFWSAQEPRRTLQAVKRSRTR